MKRSLIFILFILFLLNSSYLFKQIFNPSDTTMPESVFALISFEFSSGNEIYKDFREFPFIITPYPPLYYWFLGFSINLFNLNKENIFYFGRFVNIFLVFLLGLIFYTYLRKKNISLYSSIFSVLLLLCNFNLFPWAITLRSDIFALFFSILAFIFYNNIIFSLIFLIISFFFKPSFIAFPISFFLFHLFNKKIKKAIFFITSYLFIVFSIIILFNFKTKGMFYLNVFEANLAPLDIKNLRYVFVFFLSHSILILSLGLLGIFILKFKNILSMYCIVSLLLSLFSSLKLGSNTNYFLEPLFLFSLASAHSVERLSKFSGKILFSFSIFPLIFNLNTIISSFENLKFKNDFQIKEFIKKENGLVITDNPRFSYLSKKPFFIDHFNLNYLEKKGKWSLDGIFELIKGGEINVFIFFNPIEKPLKWQGENRIPQKLLDFLKEETYFYGKIDNYFICYKKPI